MVDKKKLQVAIGKRIKELREEHKVSQQDLAAACNFEKSNFSRLESGGTNPTLYTLCKIAEKLGVTLSEITAIEID